MRIRVNQQKQDEFENFDRTMRELIKVPHSKIKAQLDAERAKKRKAKKPSASGREDGKKS